MRIWIDLANSPHVPFFSALIPEFITRGHEVELTARDFAETVPLAIASGLKVAVLGEHGGKEISGKAGNLVRRAWSLRGWAMDHHFDMALSHNSYSHILAGRSLRLKIVTLMDYEYQPANHLAFRLATRVIVPQAFPSEMLSQYGASEKKVKRYSGTKEDVYLARFQADPAFADQLRKLGIEREDVLVVVRPPASEALYHRFENELFEALLDKLMGKLELKVLLLPRSEAQRNSYALRVEKGLIIPDAPLDGANLIAASDLVISAGGTMNREAAALGVPAATIYAGKWAAIDEELVREGRLLRISSREDLDQLPLKKKGPTVARARTGVLRAVADLIVEP